MRSVLVEKLDRCTVAIAAQQLRIHSASECDFYVRMRRCVASTHAFICRYVLSEGGHEGGFVRMIAGSRCVQIWKISPGSDQSRPPMRSAMQKDSTRRAACHPARDLCGTCSVVILRQSSVVFL